MKTLRTIVLFDQGYIINSIDWQSIHESYIRAIENIKHPENSQLFTIRKRSADKSKRNGVKYLRSSFLSNMTNKEGWQAESNVNLTRSRTQAELIIYPELTTYFEPITSDFGGFDFITTTKNGFKVAIEWETGNISSSHRSLNKLSIALKRGVINAGVLIVPSRSLYEHLTDRIGNISELSGYIELWQGLGKSVDKGLLAITVVEHDALTDNENFPYLPVGKDGRAQK